MPGSSPFARHYLGNLGWFLLLWVLRCFSSPRSLPEDREQKTDDSNRIASRCLNLNIKTLKLIWFNFCLLSSVFCLLNSRRTQNIGSLNHFKPLLGWLSIALLQAQLVFRPLSSVLRLGSPIRIPPDHSSFASSPKLFAGYHVLLRLWLPRHPPFALLFLVITL